NLRLQFERVSLRAFLDTLTTKVDSTALAPAEQVDYGLIARDARTRLLAMEEMHIYQRDPDLYHQTAAQSVVLLLKRHFAPLDGRLAAVAEPEEKMTAYFEQAKKNLTHPPKIWTQIAIEQAKGTVQFFEKVVPAAADSAKDPAVRKRVLGANDGAIAAARDYL